MPNAAWLDARCDPVFCLRRAGNGGSGDPPPRHIVADAAEQVLVGGPSIREPSMRRTDSSGAPRPARRFIVAREEILRRARSANLLQRRNCMSKVMLETSTT